MLMKAVAAVKADKAKALDMFNKGEGGFLDRDLYVFCGNVSDGKAVANGNPNRKQIAWCGRQDPQGLHRQTVMAPNSTPHTRSRKVKSPRSAICFQGQGADKTPVPKVSLVTRVSAIWAAASDITSRALQLVRFIWAPPWRPSSALAHLIRC